MRVRFDQADDRRKRRVFDVFAACRVLTVKRRARSEPDIPAIGIVHRDEIAARSPEPPPDRPPAHTA